jgi:hypothetical protein
MSIEAVQGALDFFSEIERNILNLEDETKISLLNDCFNALTKLNKENNKISITIIDLLSKETCILDKEAIELFKFFIDEFEIDKTNFLYEIIDDIKMLKGGIGPHQELVVANQQPVVANPQPVVAYPQANNQQELIHRPVVSQEANLVLACVTAGISSDQIYSLINKSLDNDRLKLQTDAIIPKMQEAEASYIRRLHLSNMVFSFSAPAALLYYLNSMLTKITSFTITNVGNIASTTVGGLELGVRNVMPGILNGLFYAGSTIKDYLPDAVKDIVKVVRSTGVTEYANESVSGTVAEKTFKGFKEGTDETLIVGCILFYIIMVIIISLLTTLILQMYKSKNFKFYIQVPGFGIGFMGGKTRKNRNRNKNRINKKKNKSYKNKKIHK